MTNAYRGHEYSGREKGLMVIASPEALRALAREIEAGLEKPPPSDTDFGWPHVVAQVNLGAGTSSYPLSFHVESPREIPKTNVPRGNLAFWAFVIMVPFAFVGLGALYVWIKGAF
jgi:hypothetical protein